MRRRRHATAVETKPGLDGLLEICTRPVDGQRIMHRGHARLVDVGDGMFLFVDAGTGIEMWLHPDEIVEFCSKGEAS